MNNNIFFDYVELISLNFYKIVFKPFVCDDFFSNILSNLIRHSLFLNTKGAAVTEVSFSKPVNEFSYFPEIKEDIINILLNLKGILFKLKKDRLFLNLKASKGIIRAKDIKLNKYSKIINKNHVICHLNNKFCLKLKIKVEKNKGFIPYNSDKKYKYCVNMKNGILMDANFCPIIRVSYSINSLNDFIYPNLKRLLFFVETNGTISGKQAIINSVLSFLKNFSNFNNINKFKSDEITFKDLNINSSLFDANFSLRTIKHLNRLNIFDLKDIIDFGKKNLLNILFFTNKTILEIKRIFKIYKLNFFI
ncbi:DNA-directed RNA polymerase subunit alpha [Candidatus Nasuia deltocephalinicola str. NAS-ALF]|uniref:DNA-directed RNA polymerase subunit alpha n=1 Tax=Candidatus Nasuia deltocephalinicola str. NAS-ALF TaxID=1343077 RepID=S5SQ27_9PROT|nr:DNA-directed RNA polymerase subunit alpha [Candidatus Nasuia deltocephalinicola str. NAS-ALF]